MEGDLVGLRFEEALGRVLGERGLLPVAVERPPEPGGQPKQGTNPEMRLNPRGLELRAGDTLVCVSGEKDGPG